MPYPPQVFSLDGHAFGLTVSGVQIIDKVPTDLSPIRWTWPSATNNGGISFTVEDQGETALPGGAVVRFTDNVNNDLLFSGPLTNALMARSAGPYRHADVTGTGWGFYLDNRAVTTLSWASADKDDTIVMRTVRQFGGPLLANAADINGIGTVAGSDGSAVKTTVRGVLSTVADQFDAGYRATRFYVDNERGIYWWYDDADEAAVAGTATSIGDEGALQPEYLT
ncbi:MAG TPA: hypothetical protein VMW94_10610, partial [Actinomycetes bacterium]|nr:hypothetical protein [Actinomycetes bacterium]